MKSITICLLIFLPLWVSAESEAYPAVIPLEKPDYPVSKSVARLYDQWNPYEDRGNELYSNFKFSPIEGLPASVTVSRRDPTKILKIDGSYHIWYTCRRTEKAPAGPRAEPSRTQNPSPSAADAAPQRPERSKPRPYPRACTVPGWRDRPVGAGSSLHRVLRFRSCFDEGCC